MNDKFPPSVQKALNALNDVTMDGTLSYEQTRNALLVAQHHVAHLLTHFPAGRSTPYLPHTLSHNARSES